ncbi:hypothetical protein AYK25_10255 [Thermoplasmatales archaeon SM1-50]|nr:MAG: hypothetical protein AYK25_10255 [Thermoplasmatales archaeon SM1-50]
MYYMITATYKSDDVRDIPKHAKEHFLKPPDGIEHIDTWIGMKDRRHFQVLRTDNESLLQKWTMQLNDLFDFEVDHVDHVPTSELDNKMQNVKLLALAYHMYADDNNGMLPRTMFDLQSYAGELYDPDAYVLVASGNVYEIEKTKDSSKEVLIKRKELLRAVAFVDGHAEIVSMHE